MLVDLLDREAVPFDTLHGRYGPLLELVRKLLGVVPNCDPYLEIWPPAFRTYNVMVPNLLNLPFLGWGLGAPRSTVGLAMYVSSRAAGCAYCSAHACSFALRRGATVEQVTAPLDAERSLSAADRAAVRVAHALGTVPTRIDEDTRADLRRHFSAKDAEWVVLAVAMMGFLNKAMDALGVPLEDPVVAEVNPVIGRSGWTPGQHSTRTVLDGDPPGEDSLLARLSVVRYAPAAIKLDREWTTGVPDRWPAVGEFLRRETGHDFPVLAHLRHRRAVRAIATMIKENLGETVLGRDQKLAAGLIYARTVDSAVLEREICALGGVELADSPAQTLAGAISPSPAAVDGAAIAAARTMAPAAVVELISFIAVLQLLHRLLCFYPSPSGVQR
ncbi:MAG: carboxymuconolactone decarboxylase family protein [Sporichthyaceae bacterium]